MLDEECVPEDATVMTWACNPKGIDLDLEDAPRKKVSVFLKMALHRTKPDDCVKLKT